VLGFTLRSEDGNQMTNQILWAKLDPLEPNSIILRALTPVKEDNFLWYGWGWDPICNVVDELDMALPAFGPMRINN
jgi:sialate O-acetylesterase